MKNNIQFYDALAKLFRYPDVNFVSDVLIAKDLVEKFYPDLLGLLFPFIECVKESSTSEMEEIYTRTFDVQAITTLDIGYVLFGDDYKRGAVLTNLNREHIAAGNDCGNELADHLPNILKLLPRMNDNEIRIELVTRIVLPALSKILSDFNSKNIDKKNETYRKHHKTILENSKKYSTIYQMPIKLIFHILIKDYNVDAEINTAFPSDFTSEIITELEINSK